MRSRSCTPLKVRSHPGALDRPSPLIVNFYYNFDLVALDTELSVILKIRNERPAQL